MSILDQLEKPQDRPAILTITGDAGTGKTTLANTFPKPVFIRVEDGLQAIDADKRPMAFPKVESVDQLMQQLQALIKEEHEFKTVVIDSVTQLETLFTDYVIANDPKNPKSLNQAMGGYGNGRQAVANLHGRVRKAAQILNDKGLFVVFIAHSDVSTIELPDQDPYSRYELRLMKPCQTHYVDNTDLVAYLKMETFTRGDGERKKAISTGSRVAVCHTDAAQVSKNRYSITEPLLVEKNVNPFTPFIKALTE